MQPALSYVASPHTATDFSSNVSPLCLPELSSNSTQECLHATVRRGRPTRSTTVMRSPRRRRPPHLPLRCHWHYTYRHAAQPLDARVSRARGLRRITSSRVCVQRSRRLFFVAAAPLLGCPLTSAGRPSTSAHAPGRFASTPRTGPARPVPYRWGCARRLLACRTRARAPIPRRPHEWRGLGLTSPPCSMPPPGVRIATQLRLLFTKIHPPRVQVPEEYCKDAGSQILILIWTRYLYVPPIISSFPPSPFIALCFIAFCSCRRGCIHIISSCTCIL
jgi:hypothetical protein